MVHGLGSYGSVVDDNSEAVLQVPLLGNLSRHEQEVTEQRSVGVLGARKLWYVLPGYDEEVHGRLGVHVVERDALNQNPELWKSVSVIQDKIVTTFACRLKLKLLICR